MTGYMVCDIPFSLQKTTRNYLNILLKMAEIMGSPYLRSSSYYIVSSVWCTENTNKGYWGRNRRGCGKRLRSERSVHELFTGGKIEPKFDVNCACSPKEEHPKSQKNVKFMDFSFRLFFWFGLPGRALKISYAILFKYCQLLQNYFDLRG